MDVVRKWIEPWKKYGETRYYVNDWPARIHDDLVDFLYAYPDLPRFELVAGWGKVWYDVFGEIHVDGIHDHKLRNFIAERMYSTQFLGDADLVRRISREVEWRDAIGTLPRIEENGTVTIEHGGRQFIIESETFHADLEHNHAYVTHDGEIVFRSCASNMEELVIMVLSEIDWKSYLETEVLFPLMDPARYSEILSNLKTARSGNWNANVFGLFDLE